MTLSLGISEDFLSNPVHSSFFSSIGNSIEATPNLHSREINAFNRARDNLYPKANKQLRSGEGISDLLIIL